MKNSFIICVILIAVGFPKAAQTQADSIAEIRSYLSTNVFSPFFRQYTLRYERLLNLKSFLRFGFRYQYPKNTDSYESTNVFIFKIVNKNSVVTAYKISTGYGRFLRSNMGLYLAIDLFYSYSFYEDIYYFDCTGMTSNSWVYLESEYNNDFGIEPQIGYKLLFNSKSRVKFFFDFYAGIGFRVNQTEEIIYGKGYGCYTGNLEYYITPEVTKEYNFEPDIVVGVNVGVAF